MTLSFVAASVFLLAGFIQGLTGFGSALVAMPLLCFFLDVKTAVPLCALSSIIITGYLLITLRENLQVRKILPLCLGALPGVLFGTTVLKSVESEILAVALGLLLMAYALYNLVTTPRYRPLHTAWAYLAGFCSGAIGAAFSAGGPPAIIHTALTNRNKNDIKATLTGFFAFNTLLVTTTHALSGLTTREVLLLFLFSAPAILLGTICGSFCYRFLSGEKFIKIIFLSLLVMGATMVMAPK